MMRIAVMILLIWVATSISAQVELGYEKGETLDHASCIAAFASLEDTYQKCELQVMGTSDVGKPIHVFTIGNMGEDRPTVLINNAIHPGESCGVDASILIAQKLLSEDSPILDKLNVVIIPMYNVGGAMNRSCCSRANQDGPTSQGFRGNARNLDLNRDFIKADSKNAFTFYEIFHRFEPEVLIDTHTSNGADYPYTMTLIHSQSDMIDQDLAQSYTTGLVPYLYEQMDDHYPMIPYVNLIGRTPESGIVAFPDHPRYSTGYAGLFDCYGFTTETHMLKPYRDRVMATYHFIDELLGYCAENDRLLIRTKERAERNTRALDRMYLKYELDTLQVDSILFKGFRAEYLTSEVTGLERLRYDRSITWEDHIPFLQHYKGSDEVDIPEYYIIPQAWSEVIERLQANAVSMQVLKNDTVIKVESYYIDSYDTVENPYEGHYLHHDITTRSEVQSLEFFQGDWLIPTNQRAKRYLVQTLEPRAKDSFFAWGFFDAVLQQKEWFSPYVFEDIAFDLVENDEELKQDFLEKKEADEEFSSSMWAQLIYIYRRSSYYEPSHMRYPVYRIK